MRHLAGDRWEVYSAGIEASFVDPRAIASLKEIGIDASNQTSNTLDEMLAQRNFDVVVSVCAAADQRCPVVPGVARRERWPFDDPAAASGDEASQMAEFRRIREQIRTQIESWLEGQGA